MQKKSGHSKMKEEKPIQKNPNDFEMVLIILSLNFQNIQENQHVIIRNLPT